MKRIWVCFPLILFILLPSCGSGGKDSQSTREAATDNAGQTSLVLLTPSPTPSPSATVTPTVNPWVEGNPGVIRNVKDVACNDPCTLLAVAADQGIFLLEATDLSKQGFIHSDADSVVFSPDGSLLAVGTYPLTLFDLATVLPVAEFAVRDEKDLAFSPDGRILAAAHGDAVSLWDVEEESRLAILEHDLTLTGFEGHSGSINRVLFSPDGSTLFTTNILTEQFESSLSWHTKLMSLSETRAFYNDYNSSLLSKVCAWFLEDASNLFTFFPGVSAIISYDSQYLISITGNNSSNFHFHQVSDLSRSEAVKVSSYVSKSDLADLALSPDGTKLAVASWAGIYCDLVLSVWNTATWEQIWEYCYTVPVGTHGFPTNDFQDQMRLYRGILFNHDGGYILYWARGSLVAIDTVTGEMAKRISSP